MTAKVDSRRSWANSFSIRLLSCIALVAVSASETMAQSAGAEQGLEEIIVTAEKRAENVQRVPLSIVAVTGEAMEAAGVKGPLDLPKLVPSLQISTSGFASDIGIRVRGFGTASGGNAVDSDVAAYIDGAFIPRPGAIVGSMLDVKNIEVLSGPQGTLFGRNAAMGAVSINTNAPSPKESFDASVEGGNYGTYKVTGMGNVPVNDQFAVRVAMQGSHTDGIYHNELDGKTYGENTGYVGRGALKWDITPDVSWVFRVDGSKNDGDGVVAEGVYTATASPAQLAAMTGFVRAFGGTAPVYSNTPSYAFNDFIGSPFFRDSQIGGTSTLSWDVSPSLTLRLIDSYRDWHDDQKSGDEVATSLDLVNVRITTGSIAQSHELQFVSARDAYLGGRLGFTSGLYYFRENYSLDARFNLGSQFCGLVYGFGAPFLVAPCLAGPQVNAGYDDFNQLATSVAGYLQVNYSLLPNLELDLGVRDTSDRKTAVFNQVTPNPLGIAPFMTPDANDLSLKETKPSYRASLSWHITDSLMAFGTFSTGYKSGGFNAAFSTTKLGPAARTYQSETVDDYELGLKSQMLDGKLILNATLFDTVLHNFQDRSYNGLEFLIGNAGAVRSRGLDLDGRWRALSSVTINYGVTYLDSIYTSDTRAPGLEGCTGTAAGGCPLVQDLSGRPLDYAPKFHGNVGLNWNVGEFRGYMTSINASESFTSSFLTANTDNPQSRLPSYNTTDLRLGIHSPNDRWEFDVFGTNVFDKHYYTSTLAQPLASSMGATNPTTGATVFRGYLGDPLRFGARVAVHF